MQNVVDVACSSPPITMNATKPTAHAAQAVDQDPFGLVLQKASERIVNDKQSDSASKVYESKSGDNSSHGAGSTTNKKVSETKNESEVKSNKPVKSDKPEKEDESSITDKKDNKSNETEVVVSYINPAITATDNVIIDNASTVDASDTAANVIQPATLSQIASSTEGQSVIKADEQVVEPLPNNVNEDAQTDAVDSEPTVSFAEALNKGAKVGENTSNDLKPALDDPNVKVSGTGKVNVNISTNTNGETEINIANRNLESVSVAKSQEKPVEVETTQQNAPPDTPDAMTGIAASASVQTSTQISEQARLAEAPKSEVINQVAKQIDQMVKTNRSSVRMQLYPEELGHIDLRIVTTKDGIGVTMVADKASTQQALKSEMESLRQSIEQAGIQLSNLNINQGNSSSKQQSFEHRQNFSNSSSYPDQGSDNQSTANEPRVHLATTLVDYKA